MSVMRKVDQIWVEKQPQYKNELLEVPIRVIYHAGRIVAHAGVGFVVGGSFAVTAPVSIPLYVWWRNDMNPI